MVKLNVLNIFNIGGAPLEQIEFPDELFYLACSERAVQTVDYVDNALRKRSDSHTKGRSDVEGSTKKIYKQKGTGGARHGAKTASLFRGGGVTFGPLNLQKKMKINKNLRTIATFTVLLEHIQKGTLVVANDFAMNEVKTKTAFNALISLKRDLLKGDPNCPESFFKSKNVGCLLVGDSNDVLTNNMILSSRNIIGAKFICDSYLNVYDLVRTNFLVMSKSALIKIINKFKERLGCE